MLTVKNLRHSFKRTVVLEGVSIRAEQGQMVGVVGPNGAGKTTLLRLIAGILQPSPGMVLINDIDLASLGSKERAKLVAVVPQEPTLPTGFTVFDLVSMGRNPYIKLFQFESTDDLDIVSWAMKKTQVLALAHRQIDTLSGGEKQRVVIAMALAQNAPILLLDEPTSNLDLSHQVQILDTVREVHLHMAGVVLIAMHDLTLAAHYCDQIVMLSSGNVFVSGHPGEVLNEENISQVYGTKVTVLQHPVTSLPVVVSNSVSHPKP